MSGIGVVIVEPVMFPETSYDGLPEVAAHFKCGTGPSSGSGAATSELEDVCECCSFIIQRCIVSARSSVFGLPPTFLLGLELC